MDYQLCISLPLAWLLHGAWEEKKKLNKNDLHFVVSSPNSFIQQMQDFPLVYASLKFISNSCEEQFDSSFLVYGTQLTLTVTFFKFVGFNLTSILCQVTQHQTFYYISRQLQWN